jgi:hypothetical protein
MRAGLCGATICGLMLPVPAGAGADGLPVQGVDAGPTGVASATVRYVSLPARPGGTLVAKVRRDGGQVLRSRMLRGSFTIPAVAYDGSASGLSADAGTLVLIRPRARFPQQRTRLVVLDAKRLRLRSSGRELSVVDGPTVVAAIDRTTFRVGAPAASSSSSAPPQSSAGGGVSWVPPAIGAALLLGLLAAAARMSRRSPVSTS